jgi:transcriptional regulator with XRE-family HTH domain
MVTSIRKIVGDNIRTNRHRLQWTQKQLADACGLSADFIGRVERGCENICMANIAAIADVLKVETATLLMDRYYIGH